MVNPDTVQSLKSRTDLSKVPDIIVGYLPLSLTENGRAAGNGAAEAASA